MISCEQLKEWFHSINVDASVETWSEISDWPGYALLVARSLIIDVIVYYNV